MVLLLVYPHPASNGIYGTCGSGKLSEAILTPLMLVMGVFSHEVTALLADKIYVYTGFVV